MREILVYLDPLVPRGAMVLRARRGHRASSGQLVPWGRMELRGDRASRDWGYWVRLAHQARQAHRGIKARLHPKEQTGSWAPTALRARLAQTAATAFRAEQLCLAATATILAATGLASANMATATARVTARSNLQRPFSYFLPALSHVALAAPLLCS
jgi:hypothetical protein